jgi:hypothetical protein
MGVYLPCTTGWCYFYAQTLISTTYGEIRTYPSLMTFLVFFSFVTPAPFYMISALLTPGSAHSANLSIKSWLFGSSSIFHENVHAQLFPEFQYWNGGFILVSKAKEPYSGSRQQCGAHSGGHVAAQGLFWKGKRRLLFFLFSKSERERNAAMLARRSSFDCNTCLQALMIELRWEHNIYSLGEFKLCMLFYHLYMDSMTYLFGKRIS